MGKNHVPPLKPPQSEVGGNPIISPKASAGGRLLAVLRHGRGRRPAGPRDPLRPGRAPTHHPVPGRLHLPPRVPVQRSDPGPERALAAAARVLACSGRAIWPMGLKCGVSLVIRVKHYGESAPLCTRSAGPFLMRIPDGRVFSGVVV